MFAVPAWDLTRVEPASEGRDDRQTIDLIAVPERTDSRRSVAATVSKRALFDAAL
jgi:hypothetical protein